MTDIIKTNIGNCSNSLVQQKMNKFGPKDAKTSYFNSEFSVIFGPLKVLRHFVWL